MNTGTENINNHFLKGFLLKLLAFFAVVIIADFALGSLLKKYYFKQQTGYDAMATYTIEKTDADILILGSSRAKNIFNPEIFEKQLKQSCYNAGRYGYPVFYHYALLKSVLKRYTPKTVILSFDAGNFSKGEESYDKLSSLLPYYNSHPEIQPVVDLKGPFEKLKKFSKIYPYNSMALSILAGNRPSSKYDNIKGFVAIDHEIERPFRTFDYTAEKNLDQVKIDTYKSFLQDCIAAKINLIVVCPPYMINATGTDKSITEGKKIATDLNINFLDYSRDTTFTNKPALFADFRHLNRQGVEIFDAHVIEKMMKIK